MSGLPHRDRGAAEFQEGAARYVWDEGGIEPGLRALPLRAQWSGLPAGQVGHEEFRSQTDRLCTARQARGARLQSLSHPRAHYGRRAIIDQSPRSEPDLSWTEPGLYNLPPGRAQRTPGHRMRAVSQQHRLEKHRRTVRSLQDAFSAHRTACPGAVPAMPHPGSRQPSRVTRDCPSASVRIAIPIRMGEVSRRRVASPATTPADGNGFRPRRSTAALTIPGPSIRCWGNTSRWIASPAIARAISSNHSPSRSVWIATRTSIRDNSQTAWAARSAPPVTAWKDSSRRSSGCRSMRLPRIPCKANTPPCNARNAISRAAKKPSTRSNSIVASTATKTNTRRSSRPHLI